MGIAVGVAAGDAAAWVIAAAGFLARGGWLLVALPILSIPSPVLLSMLFRGEVGAVGRGDAQVIALGLGALLSLVAIGGVVVSAWSDVGLAERFLRDPETLGLRSERPPASLDRAARRSAMWWVASVQAVALLPIIVAISLLVEAAVRTTTNEVTAPSGLADPLPVRVALGLAPQLLLLAAVLAVVEIASSVASRRLLAVAWGVAPGVGDAVPSARQAVAGIARAAREPLRTAATAVAGWAIVLLALALQVASSAMAWSSARDVLIRGVDLDQPLALLVAALLVVLACGVWLGGLAVVGFAVTVRAGIWTAHALR